MTYSASSTSKWYLEGYLVPGIALRSPNIIKIRLKQDVYLTYHLICCLILYSSTNYRLPLLLMYYIRIGEERLAGAKTPRTGSVASMALRKFALKADCILTTPQTQNVFLSLLGECLIPKLPRMTSVRVHLNAQKGHLSQSSWQCLSRLCRSKSWRRPKVFLATVLTTIPGITHIRMLGFHRR